MSGCWRNSGLIYSFNILLRLFSLKERYTGAPWLYLVITASEEQESFLLWNHQRFDVYCLYTYIWQYWRVIFRNVVKNFGQYMRIMRQSRRGRTTNYSRLWKIPQSHKAHSAWKPYSGIFRTHTRIKNLFPSQYF